MSSRSLRILGFKRTPIGDFGASLKNHTATKLATIASTALIKSLQANSDTKIRIDSAIFGNVMQTSADAPYLARHVALSAGLDVSTPAITINRLCGSGMQSIISACHEILLNDASCVLTGGAESMSQCPFVLRNIRFGIKGNTKLSLEDSLWTTVYDSYGKVSMGTTAENVATQYKISREECDAFSLKSQNNWLCAAEKGLFDEEIVPVEIDAKRKMFLRRDEHPRPTTMEILGKLKPSFVENGVVTAGNSSGISDGASAMLIGTDEVAKKHNIEPLGRIAGWFVVGVDPRMMGIGPIPAIKGLLSKLNWAMKDVGLFEINEAFASQCIAVKNELGIDGSILNVDGGSIAMGHPVGMSGSRIVGHLARELIRRGEKRGVASACIGGGQGIAVAIERD